MLSLSLLLACAEPPALPPEPPLSMVAIEPPLVQVLYAGESGAQARLAGDRLRALLWLRSMSLSPLQLNQLCQAASAARGVQERLQDQLHALAEQELQVLAAPNAALQADLMQGELGEQRALAHAQARAAALAQLPDPIAMQARATEATLALASPLISELNPSQLPHLGQALFMLRAQLDDGLHTAPALLDQPWRDSDFGTLRRSAWPGTQSAAKSADIGALFSLDGEPLLEQLSATELELVLALVLPGQGLAQACVVLGAAPDSTALPSTAPPPAAPPPEAPRDAP